MIAMGSHLHSPTIISAYPFSMGTDDSPGLQTGNLHLPWPRSSFLTTSSCIIATDWATKEFSKSIVWMGNIFRFHCIFIKYKKISRSQYVHWQGETSEQKSIIVGVPHGSILGLLLFTLYVNDFPDYVDNAVDRYADDRTLQAHAKDIKTVENKLTEMLAKAAE